MNAAGIRKTHTLIGIALCIVALICVLMFGDELSLDQPLFSVQNQQDGIAQAVMIQDAALDKLGVTRWAEAIAWLEERERTGWSEEITGDTIVWVGRRSQGEGSRFHSVPLCSGSAGVKQTTVSEAQREGYTACLRCWNVANE